MVAGVSTRGSSVSPRPLALITGASSGIGLEFARILAADGYDCALVARSHDRLEFMAADLREKHGVAATCITADLTLDGSIDEVFAAVPRCDLLVNNAGFANNGPYAELPENDIADEIRLDVLALARLTRRYLPGMLAARSGGIINVASTAAFLPGPLMATYYASKAFVLSLSEALWEESRGSGVTVSCLCPGATKTAFFTRAKMEGTPLLSMQPLADATMVARAGYEGWKRGKRVVIPGAMNAALAFMPRISPRAMLLRVSRRLVER